MPDSQLATRHYPKIGGLRSRTYSDVSQASRETRLHGLEFLREARGALPSRPSLVSSSHGLIEDLLLTIPAYATELPAPGVSNPLANAYRDLLRKLPKTMKLVVLTHESAKRTVSQWLRATGRTASTTLIAAPDHLHFSVWAEDAYVVVADKGDGGHYLLEPYEFPRYGDALIADFVRNNSRFRSNQAPLYFQGGNLLIGDTFFMIGADYPANTLRYLNRVIALEPGETPAKTVNRLYREYMDSGRDLIYVGSTIPVPSETEQPTTVDGEDWTEVVYFGNHEGTVQPLFHIDMFLTLAGRDSDQKYQVLVGDPAMAARALGVPVWPHAMQEVFDNIARGLSDQGFKVIRNPLPLVYVDDVESRTRLWYFATSNNALVQIDGQGGKLVWLPSYGFGNWGRGSRMDLRKTDRANRQLWESLGFKVTMLTDFHPFAENLGAVHCIKKYLSRS